MALDKVWTDPLRKLPRNPARHQPNFSLSNLSACWTVARQPHLFFSLAEQLHIYSLANSTLT